MAQLLVEDLNPKTVKRLEVRAQQHGQSLQSEVRAILESATAFSIEEARRISRQWRLRLAGTPQSDSSELLREDRER